MTCGFSPVMRDSTLALSSEPLWKKLRFRKKNANGVEDRIIAKEARLKALWSGRLGHQMEALPQYDGVFRTVHRKLRQASFPR
jgi:hypothetical protein